MSDYSAMSDADLIAAHKLNAKPSSDYQGMSDAELTAAYQKTQPQPQPATGKPAKSKDYQAGQQAPGALQGLLSVINGPLLGFGDEVAGVVGAAYDGVTKGKDFFEGYKENRDYARGAQDNQARENPWTTGLTQLAASAPLGALKLFGAPAAASAIKPMGVMRQIGQASATGAGYGTAAGAGNSTADSVAGVAGDAVKGGLIGGALSGGAIPVGRVVGAVGGNVMQRVNQTSAGNYAKEKIAEALVRDGRGAVVQSGASNPVTQAGARLNKLGGEAVIADAGGQNTRALLDLLATLPGKTKDAANQLIHSRQAGRANRLIGAADNALGTHGDRLAGTVDDLVRIRETAAEPLYRQVNRTVVARPSAELQAAISAADELGATGIGRQMSTARQQPFTLDTANPAGWAMRDLDHVKQGMDQLIAKQWDAVNGKLTPLGASYQQLKNHLVGELDAATVNPRTGDSLYRSARDAFSGPSALIDAARAGQSSISKNESAIAQLTGAMSTSEREAFKVGAFEALREKLGRSEGGRTEVLDMWRNPALQGKLKVLFGDERSFREFAATTAKEGRLKMLESTGRGSQTAARQYAAGDLDVGAMQDVGGAVASAAGGSLAGALKGAMNTWNRVKTPEAVRDQMGKILMTNGQEGQSSLASMLVRSQKINENRARQAAGAGLVLSQPNSIIGSNVQGY